MKRNLFLALAVSFAIQASGQTAVTANFAGVEVALVIPAGYCAIDRADEIGQQYYQLQEHGNSGRNKVAILFSDCNEWAKRKANPSYLLRRHGNYLFQLTRGQEMLLPVEMTRANLVKIYADYELKNAGSNVARDGLTKHLNEKLKSAAVPAPEFAGSVNLGMIDQNADAAFMGLGATLIYPSGPYRFVGVTAATTTRRVPITLNLYNSAEGGNPFNDLLIQQKKIIRAVIAQNE